MTLRAIAKLMSPMKRRIQLLITRGVVKLIDPSLMMQELQVQVLGTVLDNVEHFEQYGYTSHPHPEAEVLLASLGGRRGHTVAVCVGDRRFRLKNLQEGEVAMYTDEGDVIHFKRNNVIEINSAKTINAIAPDVNINASTKVTIVTPDCEITGNLKVGGDVNDSTGTMQAMRDTYNTHDHAYTDDGAAMTTATPSSSM